MHSIEEYVRLLDSHQELYLNLLASPEIQAMHSGFSADPSQPPTAPLPAISELKNFLSAELASFKDELKRQNDESINFAVKKIRLENSARHTFKYKGNEEQYQHQ